MCGLTVSGVSDLDTGETLPYVVGKASFGASLSIELPEKRRKRCIRSLKILQVSQASQHQKSAQQQPIFFYKPHPFLFDAS